jgi:hypothetical protein
MGAAITFLSTLPVINLIAPLLGAAAMVHRIAAWGWHAQLERIR